MVVAASLRNLSSYLSKPWQEIDKQRDAIWRSFARLRGIDDPGTHLDADLVGNACSTGDLSFCAFFKSILCASNTDESREADILIYESSASQGLHYSLRISVQGGHHKMTAEAYTLHSCNHDDETSAICWRMLERKRRNHTLSLVSLPPPEPATCRTSVGNPI